MNSLVRESGKAALVSWRTLGCLLAGSVLLAVAFVEHLGGAPAEQPAVGAPIVPDEEARRAAQMLWAVLSHAAKSVPAQN